MLRMFETLVPSCMEQLKYWVQTGVFNARIGNYQQICSKALLLQQVLLHICPARAPPLMICSLESPTCLEGPYWLSLACFYGGPLSYV
jgi:hypothetical protein